MSKTMETKSKILNLLKKKEMTITELSEALDLSTATVSQHMEELQRMGAIEKIDNEHFRKLKYYRATTMATPILAKYAVAVVVVLALLSAAYVYRGNIFSNSAPQSAATTTSQIAVSHVSAVNNGTANNNSNANSTAHISPGGGMYACPMLFYSTNGTITGYSGSKLYYINSSQGTVADYVMPKDTNATFNISELITNVLTEPSGFNTTRQHYASFATVNNSQYITGVGINATVAPASFTIANNTRSNFTVTLAANSTAQGTYWLRVDYPCGGGVHVLVTVGNLPYNGTIQNSTQIYS